MDILVPCVAALPTRMTGTWLSALPLLVSCKQVPIHNVKETFSSGYLCACCQDRV